MRAWRLIAGVAWCLGVGACAAGTDQLAQAPPPSAAQAACLGEGQLTVPRVDADPRDFDAPLVPRHVRPLVYPSTARDAGATGTVHVRVLVCADGKVSDSQVVMGAPMLDEAALEAARNQPFVVATRAGKPLAAWQDVYVEFTLP